MENVWDEIAESWNRLRQKPLTFCIKYAKKWRHEWQKSRAAPKILDIGCGNARNLLPFAEQGFLCWGIDNSRKMLETAEKYAKKHGFADRLKLRKAEATKLPFKDKSFDFCLLTRVLPLLLKKEEQEKAITEAARVLKHNGKMLVSVWNKWYWKFWLNKKIIIVPWRIPEKNKAVIRRYYMFTPVQLHKLLKKHNFEILARCSIFKQEYWVEAKKKTCSASDIS